MSLRLITGPANAGKTGEVLREALAAAAAGASPIIAVPNLADVRRLEMELSGKSPLGVRVVTLRQLTLELWSLYGDGRRVVDDPTRDALLGRIVSRGMEPVIEQAARAPGFLRLMARLAKGSGVQGGGASFTGESEAALMRLLDEYRRELAGEGLVEARWLGDLLATAAPRIDGPIGVMRFDSFAAHEVRLLAGLSRINDVAVAITWERMFAPTRANDGMVEYLARGASAHKELPDAPSQGEIQELARGLYGGPRAILSQGSVVAGLASGGEAEAVLIARTVADEVARGVAAERIVVAFPHAAHRVDSLRNALLSYGVSAEFDVAMPFLMTGFGRAWHSLVSLAAGRGERSEALTFLASPYSGLSRQAVHDLDRSWRGDRVNDPNTLLTSASRMGGECESAVGLARRIAKQPLSSEVLPIWQALADSMLALAADDVAGRVPRASAEDAAAHQALGRALAEMTGTAKQPIPVQAVLSAISAVRVHERGDEVAGSVQVCDFSRVGARRFDVVVLGGLTEDEISLGTRDSADEMLRDDLTRQLEGESGDRARLEFYSLLSRARHKLYLVRQEADSEGRERRASALWEDALDVYRQPEASWTSEGAMPVPCLRLARAEIEELAPALTCGRREQREGAEQLHLAALDRGAVTSAEGTAALANASVFSATEIEAYLACPYRWFYERVVRPEEIDEAVDARELGTHAHGLLAAFYRRLWSESGHARVGPDWLTEALELFDDVAAQCSKSVGPAGLSEEMQVARAVAWARDVVGQDAWLFPSFVPELVEFGFGDEQPFMFAGHAFKGRIDRVDACPSSVFVMDYKSSREVTGLEKLEAEGKVQAVIYACAAEQALEKPVSGSVYRSMRSRHLRGFWRHDLLSTPPAGMCEEDAIGADGFSALVARTEERVAQAISGMRAGRVPRKPAIKGACTYCALSAICEGAEA